MKLIKRIYNIIINRPNLALDLAAVLIAMCLLMAGMYFQLEDHVGWIIYHHHIMKISS